MATVVSTASTASRPHVEGLSPGSARALLVLVLAAAVVGGFVATGSEAASQSVAQAGDDLTRLLRGMAAIKVLMAAVVALGVFWRVGVGVTWPWFSAYAVALAAMAAGPGLIWDMTHVSLGAALLHGGLLATIILLFRDRELGARLSAIVAARRGSRRVR
jgi:hypothetical protein